MILDSIKISNKTFFEKISIFEFLVFNIAKLFGENKS